MNAFTEDNLVQVTMSDYLRDVHGWRAVMAWNQETFGPEGTLGRKSDKDVILTRYLSEALVKLNPGLPEIAHKQALREITDIFGSQSLIRINKDKYNLIRDGVKVKYRQNGEQKIERLRVFDFDDPENNDFLCVREMWIRGYAHRRRADIIGFVNGLPLMFCELKRPDKDLRRAFDENLSDYKDTVPHLFHFNAMVILGNGEKALMGSISADYEHYAEWLKLDEADRRDDKLPMEALLKIVCDKRRFLDLFENYVLFADTANGPAKILAKNHQYLGVNRAVSAVERRESLDGKLGVFWHTQGSGKSFSMAFFTQKVHRKLGGDYTFLVLTDRTDLDNQIYKTFASVGLANNDKDACRAGSAKGLRDLLGQQKKIVFAMIQKFTDAQAEGGVYSDRDNVIVMTDEAHRSQYGTLALNMRKGLPNASFIGFTGTPLFGNDEITKQVFGAYLSTYDFQDAIEDKATLPLFYDARGDKLQVSGNDGVSLEAQREAISLFAQRNNLSIVEWFEEKETAAKRGRPVFDAVVQSLQTGTASGLIVHKIDRSARNFSDWARIGELVDSGVDVHFAHESLDLRSRGGRLTADIQAVIAADYVRNLREETLKGIEGRLKQGLFPFGAPIGYLNTGPGQPKKPDPMRAPFVRQAFELYASQQFSLRGLVNELERRGLRNRHGKPVTKYGVENILKNRFYYGTIYLKRTNLMYSGIHEPIITKALFDRVQALKEDRHHKKHVVHNHQYRRLISCGLCNRRLYGEVQKGNVYMRCQTKGCPTTTIREDQVEAAIGTSLRGLKLSKSDEIRLQARIKVLIEQRNEEHDTRAIHLQLQQLKLRDDQLTDALIERLIDKDSFQRRKDQLEQDKRRLLESLKDHGKIADDQTTAMQFLELVKSLYFTYQIADSVKKRRIVETVFSNRSISGKNLCLTPQNWCVQVDDTLGVLCGGPDQTTSRTKEQVLAALEALDDDRTLAP